jgi:CheY-like chemotaxis protein
MDLPMPVMDGFMATAGIRQDAGRTELPNVAMTANALATDHESCLEAGTKRGAPTRWHKATARGDSIPASSAFPRARRRVSTTYPAQVVLPVTTRSSTPKLMSGRKSTARQAAHRGESVAARQGRTGVLTPDQGSRAEVSVAKTLAEVVQVHLSMLITGHGNCSAWMEQRDEPELVRPCVIEFDHGHLPWRTAVNPVERLMLPLERRITATGCSTLQTSAVSPIRRNKCRLLFGISAGGKGAGVRAVYPKRG